MFLTKKQEKELFNRIGNGDKRASSELKKANLFLVENIAKKYLVNDKKLSLKKLTVLGVKGLNKAIEKYNPASSY